MAKGRSKAPQTRLSHRPSHRPALLHCQPALSPAAPPDDAQGAAQSGAGASSFQTVTGMRPVAAKAVGGVAKRPAWQRRAGGGGVVLSGLGVPVAAMK